MIKEKVQSHKPVHKKTIVKVEELSKTYGKTVAVDNMSFEVYEGEIFGMVGPNGAGKTTTIECIEGLRQPDKGNIGVLGLNPKRDENALYTWKAGFQGSIRIGSVSNIGDDMIFWNDAFKNWLAPHIYGFQVKNRHFDPGGVESPGIAPWPCLSGFVYIDFPLEDHFGISRD